MPRVNLQFLDIFKYLPNDNFGGGLTPCTQTVYIFLKNAWQLWLAEKSFFLLESHIFIYLQIYFL